MMDQMPSALLSEWIAADTLEAKERKKREQSADRPGRKVRGSKRKR